MFTDKRFPPDAKSLGNIGGDSARADGERGAGSNAKWIRAGEFAKSKKGDKTMQLFGPTVDARDICQGALGDCWLLAAMACVAEYDGAIQSLFISKEQDPRGKYKLRLYDGVNEKWERIVIDDYIPCDKTAHEVSGRHQPLFSQPNGNELWAILLEKAFAKFCGDYAALEGGSTIWGLRAMTGDKARWYERCDSRGDTWDRKDLQNVKDAKDRRKVALNPRGEKIACDTMFGILQNYMTLGSVLCASGASGAGGLHKGHAYSILAVVKVSTHRMIQIRNPWGTGEWTGDWGDKSTKWVEHQEVKTALKHENTDDGAFWMSWEDFVKNWERVGVVDRTVDIRTLRFQIDPSSKYPACSGCLQGCCQFWCSCRGCSRLYCPHHSSDETIKHKKCCLCMKQKI